MLSIARGYDPGYLTRSVGQGAENYYLSAVAEHGEPPGVWWGEGARVLGLEPGSVVQAPVMEKLYTHFLDPRDPDFLNQDVPDVEKAYLGRRAGNYKSADDLFEMKLAAEPEATEERRQELWIESQKDGRGAVRFFDLTFSPTKSVSLLHAGLQASAVSARAAGNIEQADAYERAAGAVWEAVMAGASASLNYAREHAGAARAGYHGVSVEQRSTGRWVEAGRWVVGQFRQHTSREGDPQLHVHQAVLNKQECEDGTWRTLDSRALFKVRPAAAAFGERVMEEQLTRVLGVEWRARPDGNGREVVGVDQEVIDAFSSRRVQVTEDLQRRIEDYEAAHGRKPSARALFKMAQDATKATKAGKPKLEAAPTRAQELAEWERRTTEQEIGQLTQIPAQVLGRRDPVKAFGDAEHLAEMDMGRVIAAAVQEAQNERHTFTRFELVRYLSRHLPDHLGGLPAERVEALLEELADDALDPGRREGVRLVTAPEVVEFPPELVRENGRSVYEAPCSERYTTTAVLDTQQVLIAAALDRTAPRLEAQAVAAWLGLDRAWLEGETLGGAAETPSGGASASEQAGGRPHSEQQIAASSTTTLRLDQAAAVFGIATSGRGVDVLSAPAGAGKSYTVAQLAEMWRQLGGGRVVGLTTAQNAANVLVEEGLDSASNITRWLMEVRVGRTRVEPGQLIVVDEASMVTVDQQAAIQRLAAAHGAKVVWAGDCSQLGAPGRGGMMRQFAQAAGAYELVDVARMRETWERDASVRLREGDTQVLADYDRHGRLAEGQREAMQEAAYQAYLDDVLAGKHTMLLVPTNELASELSAQVRQQLVELKRVTEHGVRLRDGNIAGVGDIITARANESGIPIGDTGRTITNRDVLKVIEVGAGTVRARLLDKHGNLGPAVEIEAEYVAENVELGYAGTVHAAQGRTVQTCHGLVDESVTREMLYVMLTRATDGNYAYAVVEADQREADLRPGPQEPKQVPDVQAGAGLGVLAAALERTEDDQTAIEAVRAEAERVTHMGHLSAMWLSEQRERAPDAYIDQAEARGVLTGRDADRLRADQAKGSLARLLRELEVSGRDAARILDAAITERELDSADSIAETLHWRITQAGAARGVDMRALEPSEDHIKASWRERTPQLGIPAIDRFLEQLAERMDQRSAELAERAAERAPAWLVKEIGHAPDEPQERESWIKRAGRVLGYREQYGIAASDALGPAPGRGNPEQRMAWYAAYDALGRSESERDAASATLGELWVARARYEREARWAPPYVAEKLKAVSISLREHLASAVRLRARAEREADAEVRETLEVQARGYDALAGELQTQRERLVEIDDSRQSWHRATEDARIAAMRADAELRRRPEVDAAALPSLHVEASGEGPPTRDQTVDHDQHHQVHEGQLELEFEVEHVEKQPEPVEEREQAEVEAFTPGQTALDLYGEAQHAQERDAEDRGVVRAILQARTAREIIAGREAGREVDDGERLRASRDERMRAEKAAEREPERVAGEREQLEKREQQRAVEYRARARAAESEQGAEMEL
ncbi:MobF family relaxase [Nonomuraea sp. NPDC050547]|uniref:MobF family relaxase n=1 Tax=Nonomuraea sp. NPDC050547 TaxID=3364368 RepID=UPI0037A8C3F7